MRRRVARQLRTALLLVGVVILAWLPVSFWSSLDVHCPGPWEGGHVWVGAGGVAVISVIDWGDAGPRPGTRLGQWGLRFRMASYTGRNVRNAAYPRFNQFNSVNGDGRHSVDLRLPLWLLAFICLAWPVTSFIIGRREQKRGFPVEPKGAGESVNTSAS